MGSDPQYAKYPDLSLAQHIFQLSSPSLTAFHASSSSALLKAIKENAATPLYHYLANPTDGILPKGSLEWDEKLYDDIKQQNEKELESWDAKLKDAEEKAGETEIVEAMGGKAEFWTRVGEKVCF